MRRITLIIILYLFGFSSFSQEHVIYFDFDKSDINQQQASKLESVIKSNQISKIHLYGYTDTIGTLGYNESLAERRIKSVRTYINDINSSIEILSTNYGEKKSISPVHEQNRKVILKFEIEKYSRIEPIYNTPEIFQINNNKDTILKCNQGTVIYIPKNSFLLESNDPLKSDNVEFRVTEYYSTVDMLAANLTTQSDNEILETGGMLYIEAYSENTKCVLNNKKQIGIKFKNISEKDSMHIFYGESLESNINWKLSSVEAIDIVEFEELEEQEVYFVVENMPTFNGGDISKFREYINRNLKYPIIAAEKGIQGKVFVQFTIDINGLVTNTKVVRSVDPALDFEALRVIQNSPRWMPGTQRGRPVSVSHTISINFMLSDGFPLDENNRISTYSEFNEMLENDSLTQIQIDSITQKQVEINEFVSEFYLWTNKLYWINCDKFYRTQSKSDIKLKMNSYNESLYAIFNGKRSIMRPNVQDDKKQIKGFSNLPSNQEIIIIGIRLINEVTYFTYLKTKPSGKLIEPEYKQIDKDKLKEELKRVRL